MSICHSVNQGNFEEFWHCHQLNSCTHAGMDETKPIFRNHSWMICTTCVWRKWFQESHWAWELNELAVLFSCIVPIIRTNQQPGGVSWEWTCGVMDITCIPSPQIKSCASYIQEFGEEHCCDSSHESLTCAGTRTQTCTHASMRACEHAKTSVTGTK